MHGAQWEVMRALIREIVLCSTIQVLQSIKGGIAFKLLCDKLRNSLQLLSWWHSVLNKDELWYNF